MARDITAAAASYAELTENTFKTLLEMQFSGGTEYYTNNNQSVSYDGNTYTPMPFAVTNAQRDIANSITEITIDMANIDLTGTAKIANDLRGTKVVVSKLGSTNYIYPYFTGNIQAYSLNENFIQYRLSSYLSVFELDVPARTFSAKCPWVFQDSDCGYSGTAYTTCNKSWENCKARQNTENFGGFDVR